MSNKFNRRSTIVSKVRKRVSLREVKGDLFRENIKEVDHSKVHR